MSASGPVDERSMDMMEEGQEFGLDEVVVEEALDTVQHDHIYGQHWQQLYHVQGTT